ncbi:hypothetical protein ES675_13880 [Bizionia algoritergicola]|uniref:Uncharacterized protein n=1 Tax=Bizionia algoritergicola TaxID=291187 RepID=A0A5D0QR63_9FLAO|nr:hypothetical protein ES675_13880 [Bizionia algoritergicola]
MFQFRSKTNKSRSKGNGGWPSVAIAIRRQRPLCSFQENENKPRFFWFVFSSMEKMNFINKCVNQSFTNTLKRHKKQCE